MTIQLTAGLIGAVVLAATPLVLGATFLAEWLPTWWLTHGPRRRPRAAWLERVPWLRRNTGANHVEGGGQITERPVFASHEYLDLEDVVTRRTNRCLKRETSDWRFLMLLIETAIIAAVFFGRQTSSGDSIPTVINETFLVTLLCATCGMVLLWFSDLAATGLARTATWWRRR